MHLRDPFLALANAARFAREAVVVTDVLHEYPDAGRVLADGLAPDQPRPTWRERLIRRLGGEVAGGRNSVPAMVFLPDAADPVLKQRLNSWWRFTPATVERMLGVLGFGDATVTTHWQRYTGGHRTRLFTVVARRTAPTPQRIDGPYPWS